MEPLENSLATAEQRIAWVSSHPNMSEWLRSSLATALSCDPLLVLNDLEILDHLLRAWCDASMHRR